MRSFEQEGSKKEVIRDTIVSATKDYIPSPNLIFTLPGKEMIDVELFSAHFPKAIIVGVERNEDDFETILSNPRPNFLPQLTTVKDYSETKVKTTHHDVVFLDYLGPLTQDRREEIKAFVHNPNILHPGRETIVAITLAKANRSGGTEETASFLYDILGSEEEVNNINNIRAIIRNDIGSRTSRVELLEAFQYVNSAGAAPMYFLLYRVIKNIN